MIALTDELSLGFLLNNGIAIGVARYVLTRINTNLDKLSKSIDNLNQNINNRLFALENNQRQFQMQIHELKVQIDSIRHGDN